MIAKVLTEQTAFILASLAGGELHGYGIARDVEEVSEGRVKLTAGTLYGALNRLADEGLITRTRERVVDGRRRRYYSLTSAGRTALAAQVEHLRSTADALNSRTGRVTSRRPRTA